MKKYYNEGEAARGLEHEQSDRPRPGKVSLQSRGPRPHNASAWSTSS